MGIQVVPVVGSSPVVEVLLVLGSVVDEVALEVTVLAEVAEVAEVASVVVPGVVVVLPELVVGVPVLVASVAPPVCVPLCEPLDVDGSVPVGVPVAELPVALFEAVPLSELSLSLGRSLHPVTARPTPMIMDAAARAMVTEADRRVSVSAPQNGQRVVEALR